MDTCMHKTMVSVASLGKIEIIRSQEFMLSKVRLKFLKKIIILGPKTAILGPQFCRILVLGPHFWWSGESGPPGPRAPSPDPPLGLTHGPPQSLNFPTSGLIFVTSGRVKYLTVDMTDWTFRSACRSDKHMCKWCKLI